MTSGFGVPHLGPWDTISTVMLNDLHSVTKYRSPDSGLELVHTKVDGPNIHAFCIIAHKCEDNCGIPNVLNHMIWHGSKRYPHSGLLQRIASKCYSTCPEAKGEKDHCSYKFSTAGTQGFSAFLAVFFDHIFNPLLQEAVFIAEVYHIDGNGLDGGTCFNSMKVLEHDPDELSSHTIFESVFGVNSHYSRNHKGNASLFRSECNLEKIRVFHEKYFHASNCCLVVVGGIDKEELFRALAPVIHSALKSHRVRPIWTKPWHQPETPPLSNPESVICQIEFPYSFLDKQIVWAYAHVKIGIMGPPNVEQNNRSIAIRLLLEYLLQGPILSAISAQIPNRCKVEVNEDCRPSTPSSGTTLISFTEYEYKNSLFTINFTNVPAEVASSISQTVRKALINEVKNNSFRLRKILATIYNYYQKDLYTTEYHVEEKIFHAALGDFLYSSQDGDLTFDRRLNSIYEINYFLSQNGEFWKHLIQTDLLDVSWTTVVGIPSQHLHEKCQDDMQERIDWRLGTDNLRYMKKWVQRLRTSSRMLSRSPPVEYLNKYPLPNADSIGMTKIHRQDNPTWASDTICNLYVDDINSNYAYLTVIMDTSEMTQEQKKYLPLFAEGILQAPYMDTAAERFYSAMELEKQIKKDVIRYETYFGLEGIPLLEESKTPDCKEKFISGSFPHLLCLRMQMEVTKVKEGFSWAQNLLWNTKWHGDKLREVCIKLGKAADEMQNDGKALVQAMLTDALYHMDSIPKCISFIRQKTFLKGITDELPKSLRKISKILERIRHTLLRPENVTVHFATSLPRMEFHLTESPDAKFAISELFRNTFNYTAWNWESETKRLANYPDSKSMRSREYLRKCCCEQVLPLIGQSTLSYLLQAVPGVSSYCDPDYPAILTAIEYFVQEPNGPLYKEIIDAGLAEHLAIRASPLERTIYFELHGCPDLSIAYTRIFEVMTRHLFDTRNGEGDVPDGTPSFHWDNFLLQSAKSLVIFKLTQMENNPMKMGFQSLASYYKELSIKDWRYVMDAITKVSMKQLQTIARRYFYPLFLQPTTCAATIPHERVYVNLDNLLQRCGKKLSVLPPLEQSTLSTFNN